MAPANLGTKRQCPKCAAKFYDFGAETDVPCPKCGKTVKADAPKKRKAKAAKPEKKETPINLAKVPIKKIPMVQPKENLPEEVEEGGEPPELEVMEEEEEVELTSLEEVEEHEDEDEDPKNSDDAEDEMFTELEGGDKLVDDLEDYIETDEDEEDDETEEE